jgi:hypothetical protein
VCVRCTALPPRATRETDDVTDSSSKIGGVVPGGEQSWCASLSLSATCDLACFGRHQQTSRSALREGERGTDGGECSLARGSRERPKASCFVI